MTIVVTSKGVYGRELFYPANQVAELLTQLLNRQSFTRPQLRLLREIGFEVVVSPSEI